MKTVLVAVKKRGCRFLDIRFSKFLARTKALFQDRARQQMTQLRAHHRCRAPCGGRSKKNVEDHIGLRVNLDQEFSF
jgi:hypothetical protein